MKIFNATIDQLTPPRERYFKSLPQFQELYLELMVADSDLFSLYTENKEAGYVIRNSEGILIEFFLEAPFISRSPPLFNQVLEDLSIHEIYCKSFDSLLLNCCLAASLSHSIIGVLYRDYPGTQVMMDPNMRVITADQSDINHLMEQDESIQELFETREQLTHFIENDEVRMFYLKKDFAGCGTMIRTHPNWNYCDLGLWVHPSFRRRGLGTQILLHLKELAEKSGLTPSCGCAIENIASQKTIEKSGFVSKHKLIRFTK